MKPLHTFIVLGTSLGLLATAVPSFRGALLDAAIAPAWGQQDRGRGDKDRDRKEDREDDRDRDRGKDREDRDNDRGGGRGREDRNDRDTDRGGGKEDRGGRDSDRDSDRGSDRGDAARDNDRGGGNDDRGVRDSDRGGSAGDRDTDRGSDRGDVARDNDRGGGNDDRGVRDSDRGGKDDRGERDSDRVVDRKDTGRDTDRGGDDRGSGNDRERDTDRGNASAVADRDSDRGDNRGGPDADRGRGNDERVARNDAGNGNGAGRDSNRGNGVGAGNDRGNAGKGNGAGSATDHGNGGPGNKENSSSANDRGNSGKGGSASNSGPGSNNPDHNGKGNSGANNGGKTPGGAAGPGGNGGNGGGTTAPGGNGGLTPGGSGGVAPGGNGVSPGGNGLSPGVTPAPGDGVTTPVDGAIPPGGINNTTIPPPLVGIGGTTNDVIDRSADPAERANDRGDSDVDELAGRYDLEENETFDNDGFLARRGEIIAMSSDALLRRRAEGMGLSVVQQEFLASLNTTMYRIEVPAASPIDGILARLKAQDPDGVFDRNHLYERSASSATPTSQSAVISRALLDTAKGISVGLIDTGVDALHPALRGTNVELQYFVDQSRQLPEAHGTAVVSLLVSPEFGVLPDAQLYVACVFYEDRRGGSLSEARDLVRALDWLMKRRVPVINMSLSGPPNAVLHAAIQRALRAGHLIVAAVGNGGPASPPLYPAAYEGVVAVTAVDEGQHVYRRASRGSHVELSAMGVDVIAAAPAGLATYSGTSFASPYVAALAALEYRTLDPQKVSAAIESLRENALDLGKPGRDEIYGFGLARPRAITTVAR